MPATRQPPAVIRRDAHPAPNPEPHHPPPTGARAPARRAAGIDWFRFWVQMAIAAVVFNIVAALVAWYFVLPRLHPPH
jgi:hypothetical protein